MKTSRTDTKRDIFFNVLEDVFLGKVKNIEGLSATVKLMKIKNKYYQNVIKPTLEREIKEIIDRYPDFEEELYDKLYTFFSRYFTEGGAIAFAKTPFHNNIYDRIYTNEKDVILFWKTRDLYYIKTERVFRSMEFDYKDYHFVFDASQVEGKRGNEKRSVIFTLKGVEGRNIIFEVHYKEGSRETPVKNILKSLQNYKINLTEEDLKEIFRTYNRQTEIDFFIHKRPREFLKEQFNLWLYQYLSTDHEWPIERLNQFNLLRKVAFKLIDMIAQFEEEVLKIWLKPRFVLNSHYVISLDRIVKNGGWHIIEKLQKHSGWQKQIREWIELGILKKAPDRLVEEDLIGKRLKREYQFLPVDTKYFKDLESEILALFEDLDSELDGWLIKSENFQALNTILPKFRGKVRLIFIDPPFIVEDSKQFLYMTGYRLSSWLCMLENRIVLAKDFLTNDGNFFINTDDSCNGYVRVLLDNIFSNFQNEIIWAYEKPGSGKRKLKNNHASIYYYSKTESPYFKTLYVPRKGEDKLTVRTGKFSTDYEGKVSPDWWNDFWDDIPSFATAMTASERTARMIGKAFYTQLPEKLLYRIIKMGSEVGDLVMDFFLGSGTTVAVAQKMKRKWIGIEMGEHFYDIILPRLKKVLYYDPSGISKIDDVRSVYNPNQAGGFFVYFELEQFEDILCKANYSSDICNSTSLFDGDYKLLQLISLDDDLFSFLLNFVADDQKGHIDLFQSISFASGKKILKIRDKEALLEGGLKINLEDIDIMRLKSLIYWM